MDRQDAIRRARREAHEAVDANSAINDGEYEIVSAGRGDDETVTFLAIAFLEEAIHGLQNPI